MTYNLEFDSRALKEFQKLGEPVKLQFKKKLAEVLDLMFPLTACADYPTAIR